MRELILNNTINHLNYVLHVHSTVFIASEKALDILHGVTREYNAALTDHFTDPFVHENVACIFDVKV